MVNWYANSQWPSSAFQLWVKVSWAWAIFVTQCMVDIRVPQQNPTGHENSQDTKGSDNQVSNFVSVG
jgi:hypothetical protein